MHSLFFFILLICLLSLLIGSGFIPSPIVYSLACVNTKQYDSPLILVLVALITVSLLLLRVDQKTQAFKEVVIIRHPRLGEYVIGFNTYRLVLQVHILD
jgi:type II secretory pathway component PulF